MASYKNIENINVSVKFKLKKLLNLTYVITFLKII